MPESSTRLVRTIFSLLFITTLSGSVFSQKEANFWYFGFNAGLDFTSGTPVAVTTGAVSTSEGSASISSAAGVLLFYTDGITVFNKNNLAMPNGFGLFGNPSSTQSGVIIQQPGSTTLYYIFTADIYPGQGVNYSIVDMTLNGGLGDVTVKNSPLSPNSSEKVTGIRHCNNKDVWVVTHDAGTNRFSTFLLTSAGINTTAVTSNAGMSVNAWSSGVIGYMKASPDGTKLAFASWESAVNRFELFDFNKSTGFVSNPVEFPEFAATSGSYGLEFSPDGTKLYGAEITPANIYQFNLCAGDSAAIASSGILIGTGSSNFTGSLQLGPDNKIYVAQYNEGFLGVISNPNVLGIGCNFVDVGPSLGGKTSSLGLPNFVTYYFNPVIPPFSDSIHSSVNCLQVDFTAPAVNLTRCSGSTKTVTSLSWDFNDPSTGANNSSTINNPTHIFSANGTYNVALVLHYACGSDTIKGAVNVKSCVTCAFTAQTAVTGNVSCHGDSTGSANVTAVSGTGPYTYSWSNGASSVTSSPTGSVKGLKAGTYVVTVTDGACPIITSVIITEPAAIVIQPIFQVNTACGSNAGSAVVTATGGTGTLTYSWSNAASGQSITGLSAKTYSVTVTDGNSCTAMSAVTITNTSGPTVTLGVNGPILCNGDTGSVSVSVSKGTSPFTYSWSTGATSVSASATQPLFDLKANTYTVTLTDASGCTNVSTVTLTEPPAIGAPTFNVTNAKCTASSGVAVASAKGGTGTLTYSWSNGSKKDSAVGLIVGSTYTVTVSDANSCTVSQTVAITQTSSMILTTVNQVVCSGAPADLATTVSKGTAPYTYSWNPGGGNSNNYKVTALTPAVYTVTVTDAGGCTQTQTLSVGVSVPVANAGPNQVIVKGSSAQLTGSGGKTCAWLPAAGLNRNSAFNPVASPTVTTTYTLTVTDSLGCTAVDSVVISVYDCTNYTVFMPTAFSPNGDGQNDMLYLHGTPCLTTVHLAVYDRWGEQVFETTDISRGWDGTFKGKQLDSAVFIYYLTGTFSDGQMISKKGNVTLLR